MKNKNLLSPTGALLLSVLMLVSPSSAEISSFSIAAVADPQYADTDARGGGREPWEGVNRINNAVSHWNKRDLDWGVILGDLIDWDDIDYKQFPNKTVTQGPQDWKDTKAILKAWERLSVPKYTVLGNHDYYVPYEDTDGMKKPQSVFRAFGFKDKAYYQFPHKGFRFVVLDGDNYLYRFHPDSPEYKEAADYYKAFKGPQKNPWNAGISLTQRLWLMDILDKALAADEPTVIMCHYPSNKPFKGHTLLNAEEMLALLAGYPNVVLWLNGHNHAGDYAKEGTRHHLTLKGMQNEGHHWYQLDFSKTHIKAYQALDLEKPKHDLDITRPRPTIEGPQNAKITKEASAALLSWDTPPAGTTEISIERRHLPTAEAWSKVSALKEPSATSYKDSPAQPITEYAYRLRFIEKSTGSLYSTALKAE